MRHSEKHYPSLAAAARATGITRATLARWRDVEGVEVLDPQALAARQGLKQLRVDAPGPATATPAAPAAAESYSEARRRRAIADADRAEISAAREAGDSVPFVAAERAAHVVFVVVRAALRELEGNLPCVLEGRRPEQMAGLLRQAFDELQERMATVDFFPNHPETVAFKKRMAELDAKTLCRRCRKTLETETC
jgi:hypothetical protein